MTTTMFLPLLVLACCAIAARGRMFDKDFFNDLKNDSRSDSEINVVMIHHRDYVEHCLFNTRASICAEIYTNDVSSQKTDPTSAGGHSMQQLRHQQVIPTQQQQQQNNGQYSVIDRHGRQKRSGSMWPCIAGLATCAGSVLSVIPFMGLTTPEALTACATLVVSGCGTTVGLTMAEIHIDGQTSRIGYAEEEHFINVDSNTLMIVVPNRLLTQCAPRKRRALTNDFTKKHVVRNQNQWDMLERGDFAGFVRSLPSETRRLIEGRPLNTFINLVNQEANDRFTTRSNNVPCAVHGRDNPRATDMGQYNVITFRRTNSGEYHGVPERSGCLHVLVQSSFDGPNQVNHLTRVTDAAVIAAGVYCISRSKG